MIETPVRETPVAEPTTPIRPSEALRLGRLIRPRRTAGEPFDGDDGACALGSMMAAVGLPSDYWALGRRFPGLQGPSGDCPEARCSFLFGPDALQGVYHLNDLHDYTDDQIVSWLQERGL